MPLPTTPFEDPFEEDDEDDFDLPDINDAVVEPTPAHRRTTPQRPAVGASVQPQNSAPASQSPQTKPSPRSGVSLPKTTKAPRQEPETFVDENGKLWAIDPRTGVQYRVMNPTDKNAVRAAKATGGFGSVSDMRAYIDFGVDDEFDVDDLVGAAELLLPHLRVPPDEAEMKRLRELRKQQEQKQNIDYAQYVKEEEQEEAKQREKDDAQLESRLAKMFKRGKKK